MADRVKIENKIRPASTFVYFVPIQISVSHPDLEHYKIDGITDDLEFFLANDKNLNKTKIFRQIIDKKLGEKDKKKYLKECKSLLFNKLRKEDNDMSSFIFEEMVKEVKDYAKNNKK